MQRPRVLVWGSFSCFVLAVFYCFQYFQRKTLKSTIQLAGKTEKRFKINLGFLLKPSRKCPTLLQGKEGSAWRKQDTHPLVVEQGWTDFARRGLLTIPAKDLVTSQGFCLLLEEPALAASTSYPTQAIRKRGHLPLPPGMFRHLDSTHGRALRSHIC